MEKLIHNTDGSLVSGNLSKVVGTVFAWCQEGGAPPFSYTHQGVVTQVALNYGEKKNYDKPHYVWAEWGGEGPAYVTYVDPDSTPVWVKENGKWRRYYGS